MKTLDKLQRLFKPGKNGESAVVGIASVKHIVDCFFLPLAEKKEAIGHRKLIKIHEHRDIALSTQRILFHFRLFYNLLINNVDMALCSSVKASMEMFVRIGKIC